MGKLWRAMANGAMAINLEKILILPKHLSLADEDLKSTMFLATEIKEVLACKIKQSVDEHFNNSKKNSFRT